MNKLNFLIILLVSLWLIATKTTHQQGDGVVKNKEDMKNYVKQIHGQFGIVGRPRFGKRYNLKQRHMEYFDDLLRKDPTYNQFEDESSSLESNQFID
jgi:hypothetical protein